MSDSPDHVTITPFYSRSDGLDLPFATYVVKGEHALVLIDPGPRWHFQNFAETLTASAPSDVPVVVVIQSFVPGALDALPLLSRAIRKRVVVAHWKLLSGAAGPVRRWNIRELSTKSLRLPVSASATLVIAACDTVGAPGSLMSFERSTGTLFSGPFLGSLGPGKDTDLSALRRESVRVYRDAYAPHMPPDLIERVFGDSVAVNQIAPTFGRLAVGGTSFVRSLFRDVTEGEAMVQVLHRLFVRAAALVGLEAASGVYRAVGLPVPDLDRGFSSDPGADISAIGSDPLLKLLGAFAQWTTGRAMDSLLYLASQLVARHDIEISSGLERLGVRRGEEPGAAGWASSVGSAGTAISDASPKSDDSAIGTPDMPGTWRTSGSADANDLIDSATGLMNETVFKQRLAGQFGGSEIDGRGSLLLVSIDGIERINNTYGRKGGDEALYTIAYLLRNFQSAHSRRGAHRLYKLTGPVFAYVLTQGTVAEGAEIAEQIRRTVAESAMFFERLTVSIGVVGLDEITTKPSPENYTQCAEEVTGRAFGRLRVAQHGGANTVCVADPAGATGMGAGSTILVADPDAPYLRLLTSRLETEGYTVLLAQDGAEALQVIDQIVPDAIVSEVMLPKINGFDLRETLRHDTDLNRIPFILVSNRRTEEMLEKAAMLGILHFLAKPVSLVEIVGLLRNLTGESTRGMGASVP